jgi:Xaa-Pro aminopeptidase
MWNVLASAQNLVDQVLVAAAEALRLDVVRLRVAALVAAAVNRNGATARIGKTKGFTSVKTLQLPL